MKPLSGLWTALKLLISLAFLGAAGLVAVAFFKNPSFRTAFLGAVVLAMAALPWVMHLSSRNRLFVLAWACVALGVAFLRLVYLTATGAMAYPRDCAGASAKGRASCEFLNALAAQWGSIAVSGVWLAISAMLIAGGLWAGRLARREPVFSGRGDSR